MPDRRVLSLLGRWHQWRRAYSHERGFARAQFAVALDDEDELEELTMRALEEEMDFLEVDERLALQHVARAECMGVEVMMNPRLGTGARLNNLVDRALTTIEKRLLRVGIL